ncbi:DEKNAAC101509 [Brettanomyces naardenensis]|uniref:DEKNAAC101510 n=1 Tax=Brettanomyces naardenensis TaxID=13370 RepID=A0A448YI45_BRENA|nr:DEKNAAC101509 [Brettanomyces naardenensis]
MPAGISALSKNVRELRFLLSQTGESSKTLKSFLVKSYKPLKAANPDLPILIREASGVEPTLVIRLDKGVEVKRSLNDLSESEILDVLGRH